MIQMDKVKLDASQVIMQYPSENRREPGRQDLKAWALSAEDSKSGCCFPISFSAWKLLACSLCHDTGGEQEIPISDEDASMAGGGDSG